MSEIRTHVPVPIPETREVSAVLSVGKALTIVEALLQASGPLPAREIGERSGVNRTTAHRLLNTLMLHGWVERHVAGGYRLSMKFLALAHVGVLDGFDIVHVDKIESLEHVGVSSRIGARGVTHRTALGKALLAASPDAFVTAYIEQGRGREDPYTVAAAGPVWDAVRRTREAGYSIDDEDDSVGVRCLGAAICGAGGHPLFAVSITGPSPRFTRAVCDRLAPTLLSVAGQLSQRFGGEGEPSVRASVGGVHDAA